MHLAFGVEKTRHNSLHPRRSMTKLLVALIRIIDLCWSARGCCEVWCGLARWTSSPSSRREPFDALKAGTPCGKFLLFSSKRGYFTSFMGGPSLVAARVKNKFRNSFGSVLLRFRSM